MFFLNAVVMAFYLYFGWKVYKKLMNWLDCCSKLKELKAKEKDNDG